MPTASERRRISLLSRSSELLLHSCRECSFGKVVKARISGLPCPVAPPPPGEAAFELRDDGGSRRGARRSRPSMASPRVLGDSPSTVWHARSPVGRRAGRKRSARRRSLQARWRGRPFVRALARGRVGPLLRRRALPPRSIGAPHAAAPPPRPRHHRQPEAQL